jgi:NADH dehydrogenase
LTELRETTLPLKDLDDAVTLRSNFLLSFEQAALEADLAERRRLMTVVVVGGGPTGVELAGAIAELRRHVLPRDFPSLDLENESRVVLVEATDALLPGFPPSLQRSAARQLESLGVDVLLGSPVESSDARGVSLKSGTRLDAATAVWVAGVRASPLGQLLGVEPGRNGRIPVTPALQHPSRPDVFVVGDQAEVQQDGRPLPMMAPVAIQQGRAAAANIERLQRGEPPLPFRYRDRGVMATIGRQRAVAYVKPLRLTGFLAWVTWLTVHLFWLIGFRNKMLVMVEWAWNYFFYEQGARVISRSALTGANKRTRVIPNS